MKSIIPELLFLLALTTLYFSVNHVQAATSQTINSTVTAQSISISVSDGAIAYGILAADTSKHTNELGDTQTVTNASNVVVDTNVRGTNTATWTLGATTGSDQYIHKFCLASCSSTSNYTAMTTNYQSLVNGLGVSGTQNVDFLVTTPTSTTSFTQQSADVVIQAVAP